MTSAPNAPRPWTELPEGPRDIRLVACDMDGTLLTAEHEVPDAFWPLLEHMRERGIVFVPASGRQCATLEQMFPVEGGRGLGYIGDNGTVVKLDGRVVTTVSIDRPTTEEVVRRVRQMAEEGHDIGLVYATADAAFAERRDEEFTTRALRYYAALQPAEDLLEVDEDAVKLAIFLREGAEGAMDSRFGDLAESHQVTLGGSQWIDIMTSGVHKGSAVRELQRELGVSPAQTAVFGDYLNDLEMMGAGDWSVAMPESHPDVLAASAWQAPSFTEDGVPRVLARLLGI